MSIATIHARRLTVVAAVALACCCQPGWTAPPVVPAPAETGKTLRPPVRMRVRALATSSSVGEALAPDAAAWNGASPTRVLLVRTPRIYQRSSAAEIAIRLEGILAIGTPVPLAVLGTAFAASQTDIEVQPAPALEARALRCDSLLVVRLRWSDSTEDAPTAPTAKSGAGRDAKLLYKRPTAEPSAFADAAAVMVPENWTGPGFPSLQMGDKSNPVRIAYWNASRGAEELVASGRATPNPTGKTLAFRAAHANGQWTLTLAVPMPPAGSPMAFAIWNGASSDRDGKKCFSPWYVLTVD